MIEGVTPVTFLALSIMVNIKSDLFFFFLIFFFPCIAAVEEAERAMSAQGRVIQ